MNYHKHINKQDYNNTKQHVRDEASPLDPAKRVDVIHSTASSHDAASVQCEENDGIWGVLYDWVPSTLFFPNRQAVVKNRLRSHALLRSTGTNAKPS